MEVEGLLCQGAGFGLMGVLCMVVGLCVEFGVVGRCGWVVIIGGE